MQKMYFQPFDQPDQHLWHRHRQSRSQEVDNPVVEDAGEHVLESSVVRVYSVVPAELGARVFGPVRSKLRVTPGAPARTLDRAWHARTRA